MTIGDQPETDEPCCTPAQAWSWCRELLLAALAGDDDAQGHLPDAVDHYLKAVRPAWTPNEERR